MSQISSPHDKLFKELWSNRETAISFFANYLPPDIGPLLRLETLEICKDSFVNPDLQAFYSDLLYKAQFGDRNGYLYLLFEHKSHPEKQVILQLLSYLHSIWTLHQEQEKGPLPVILPLVLYHGAEKWPESADLLSLMAEPDQRFHPYIPNFQFVLYDLSKFSDEDIKGEILCRTGLLLLKHVFTPGYEQKIPDILSLLKTLLEKQTGLQYIETVLRYILATAEHMTAEDLKQVVEEKLSTDRGAMIMTIAERIRQEGEKRLLCRQIARKYGLSSDEITSYLQHLKGETLLELSDRILEWDSFDQVRSWIQQQKKHPLEQ